MQRCRFRKLRHCRPYVAALVCLYFVSHPLEGLPDMAKKKETAARELPMELPRVGHISQQGRDFRLRLPPDLSEEIEKESVNTGLPQNRIIINRLARFGQADKTATMDGLIGHMETLLARYGAQQSGVELSKDLLRAVDDILAAKPNELQARVEGLRVVRRAMREIEQAAARTLATAKKRTE